MQVRKSFWRFIHFGPLLVYTIGLGPLLGKFVLLLTTVGRKSGKLRTTPLAYELYEGAYFVASARGNQADWVRNLLPNSQAGVRVGRIRTEAVGEVVTDAVQIADYFERLKTRSPGIFKRGMRMEGLPDDPSRGELEALAAQRPMVILHPKD